MARNQTILKDLHEAAASFIGTLSHQRKPVIGWCCSYMPVEVLESAGLVPFRLLPAPPAKMGDAYLNPNFCPYVRAVMGEGLGEAYPFLSGLVIVNTCDGMRRLFDAWSHFRPASFVHLIDLPRVITPPAREYFKEEIKGLVDRISTDFRVSIENHTLRACVQASNETRTLLNEIQDAMRHGRLDLTCCEWSELLRAAGILPRERYNELLRGVRDLSPRSAPPGGIPILLTGSMLENPEIPSMIEAYGGRVVAEDLCITGRRSEDPIPLTEDPLTALARHYLLRPPCARMQESQRRVDYIVSLVRSCNVRGVVYYTLKFCDTFLYEAPGLKDVLDQMGIPMLLIESEYRRGRGGSMQTRVQAFLEMLTAASTSPQRDPSP
jgi:benzoyl-CoA reductase/2-hydroxyglutaryl-CoA dehydratase subunit BcrC/BadD/HgdB